MTGSELYVYELARQLTQLRCNVTVATIDPKGPLLQKSRSLGIIVTKLGHLKSSDVFDVIHTQHYPVTEYICSLFPSTKKLCSIHSEVIDLERPYKHPSIKLYIAVRSEIELMLKSVLDPTSTRIKLIYNPVDETRFKPASEPGCNAILFVGTVDYLRKLMLFDLLDYTKTQGSPLWIIGENKGDYLGQLTSHDHVRYLEPVMHIEYFTQRCYETAGIMLGRTTIEGWLCGKRGWIYTVSPCGKIIDKTLNTPPSNLDRFHSAKVAKDVLNLYRSI